MQVTFDQVSAEYSYPIGKKDIKTIKAYVPTDVFRKIRRIRFGCNLRTGQEGHLTQRTNVYDIRINFCLHNDASNIITDDKKYLEQVRRHGGEIDFDSGKIRWNKHNAKLYAFFILAHEIAHIAYFDKSETRTMGSKGSTKEESWCNLYAERIVKAIKAKEPPNKAL